MRIIAGAYKGRRLSTVKDLSVRPATDRVKQTIFDTLTSRMDWDGARVLDLFAGSGNLGIEALSRGAEHVTFVESGGNAVSHIEKNIAMIGCEADTEVIQSDALSFVRQFRGDQFDLVFADPPYAYAETALLPGLIFNTELVKPDGYLLIEHTKDVRFPENGSFKIALEKRFGRTVVSFFRKAASDAASTDLQ